MDVKGQFVNDVVAGLYRLPAEDAALVKSTLELKLHGYNMSIAETLPALNFEDNNQRLLKMFFASKLVKGCSQNTIIAYNQRLKIFFEFLKKDALEITTADIRYFLAYEETQRGLAKTTIDLALGAIRSFYAYLQNEEILIKNPAAKIEPIKLPKKKLSAFSREDVEKLRGACKNLREQLYIEGLLSTGCRISEFVQIKRTEINNDTVLVHGKGNKERYVYLNDTAKNIIERYLAQRNDANPYLLERARNQQNYANNHVTTRGVAERLVDIGKIAGVENVHPHRFRRTFATNALRNGMPIEKVSLLLGHANVGVTQRYLDIHEEELKSAHKKYVV